MSTELTIFEPIQEFPPLPPDSNTPAIRHRTEQFFLSIAELFETWVQRKSNAHTQRSYRQGVMLFVRFMGFRWPEEDWRLVRDVTVPDVHRWRESMLASGAAPNTLNHHVSACSRFYDYLQAQAANFRIPILIANPFHRDFIARERAEPRRQARAIPLNALHQLFAMPEGDGLIAWRDRALLRYMYGTGAREMTACVAQVSDIEFDEEEGPKVFIRVKGGKSGWMGLHIAVYQVMREYLAKAELTSGPLFPTQLNPKSHKLGRRPFTASGMTKLLNRYLEQLPQALVDEEHRGVVKRVRRYSSHSFRRTAAEQALRQGVDIRKVQKFLKHEQVTTTEVYDPREFSFREGVSHLLPM